MPYQGCWNWKPRKAIRLGFSDRGSMTEETRRLTPQCLLCLKWVGALAHPWARTGPHHCFDATIDRIDGGYSSAAERLTVAQDVVGSIPTSRPNSASITYLASRILTCNPLQSPTRKNLKLQTWTGSAEGIYSSDEAFRAKFRSP